MNTGYLLREIQGGKVVPMPDSRPMPSIGPRCHELRIKDGEVDWRIIYRLDPETVLVVEVFAKKTKKTPEKVVKNCRGRLNSYDSTRTGEG